MLPQATVNIRTNPHISSLTSAHLSGHVRICPIAFPSDFMYTPAYQMRNNPMYQPYQPPIEKKQWQRDATISHIVAATFPSYRRRKVIIRAAESVTLSDLN